MTGDESSGLVLHGCTWIGLTLLAATMQAVRTAAQKSLAGTLSPAMATLVRYLFGLPFALLWLVLVVWWAPTGSLQSVQAGSRFLVFATLAGGLQILATVALVALLVRRNFAVGTALAKTETLLTALLALMLFAEPIPALGWISVMVGAGGLFALSGKGFSSQAWSQDAGQRDALTSVGLGLLAGLCFALTSLLLRQASLSLQGPAFLSAAITLCWMVCLQSLVCCVWVSLRDPQQWARLRARRGVAVFVGLTSVLGSIGWFTAMTLQHAAYVKALGQIEIILSLLITGRVFRESLTRREAIGVALLVLSVVILLLA